MTSTTTGPTCAPAPTIGLSISFSAANRRDTPMEKPVAGTGSERNLPTRIVVAAAAAHRTETHGLARPSHAEGQFRFEDQGRVIFEAAHDRRIDQHAIPAIRRPMRMRRCRSVPTRLSSRALNPPPPVRARRSSRRLSPCADEVKASTRADHRMIEFRVRRKSPLRPRPGPKHLNAVAGRFLMFRDAGDVRASGKADRSITPSSTLRLL